MSLLFPLLEWEIVFEAAKYDGTIVGADTSCMMFQVKRCNPQQGRGFVIMLLFLLGLLPVGEGQITDSCIFL